MFRVELDKLAAQQPNPDLPLRLIGMRETRPHNSWLHNIPSLIGEREQRLRINPADAAAAQVSDGELVTVRTAHGELQIAALITEEMFPGSIALPHGWGHRGG